MPLPYKSGLVPHGTDDAPANMEDIERYLVEEFRKIELYLADLAAESTTPGAAVRSHRVRAGLV